MILIYFLLLYITFELNKLLHTRYTRFHAFKMIKNNIQRKNNNQEQHTKKN
jgi:hypothetical protein